MMKKLFRGLFLCAFLFQFENVLFGQEKKTESVVMEPKKRLPPSVFFDMPEKTMITVSPDGKYLAYLAPFKETLNLFVEPINGGEMVRLSAQAGSPVEFYQWAADDVICYEVSSGDYGLSSVYAANIFIPESGKIISGEGMDARILKTNAVSAGAYHFMQKAPGNGGYDLCNFSFELGTLSTVISGRETGIFNYYVAYDGGRMVALESNGVNNRLLFVERDKKLSKVLEFPASTIFTPVAFDSENKTSILAISNLNRKNAAIVSYDFIKGKENKVVFEVADYDVVKTHNNLGSNTILQAVILGKEMLVKPAHPAYNPIHEQIATKLGAKTQFVVDAVDRKGNNFIVHTVGNRAPAIYYRYNVPNKELKELSSDNRDLTPLYLVDVVKNTFVNRSGKELNAWVSLPNTGSIQAPVVLYIPDASSGMFIPEFNREIQLLSNNGNVVWIFDFRSNPQYEQKLLAGKSSEWAQTVSEDIIDAAKHLIKTGKAHPDKITLMAHGLSTPLAIKALQQEPDLFCSSVCVNGVFDYANFIQSQSRMARDPHPFVAMLKQDSGVSDFGNVSKDDVRVSTPMLFVRSNFDGEYPSQQSDDAAVALAKKGNTPEIFSVDDAHDIFSRDNKIAVWQTIQDYLTNQNNLRVAKKANSGNSVPERIPANRK